MRCFYHRDLDAVASCKNCGRGLCPDCSADVGNGLACRGRCEAEVRSLNRVIERNKTAYAKTSAAYLRIAVFYVALSAACLLGAFVNWRGFGWVLYPAAVAFLVSGFVHFSTSRRFQAD
jgi:hypothetical protein